MNAPDRAPLRLTAVQPRRRLRLQDRARACCSRSSRKAGRAVLPEGAAGRHRDLRRRRRLPAERAAGDRRDDRLLHADRRRPVRLRRDRRDQRDLRRLRDGRHAALRAGARRHADRQAAGRDDPPHPRGRRVGLRAAPASRSPAATRSTRSSRSTGSSSSASSTRSNLKRNAGAQPGDRARARQAARRRHLQRGAEEGTALAARATRAMLASTTQLNTPGIAFGAMPAVHALTDVTGFGLARPPARDLPRVGRRARRSSSRACRCIPACCELAARGHRHRRVGAQLGGLRGRRHARRGRSTTSSARCSPIRRPPAACSSRARRTPSTRCSPSSATRASPTPRSIGEHHGGTAARSSCADAPARWPRDAHAAATRRRLRSPRPSRPAPRSASIRASDFRLTDGRCRDCPTIRQALWYFRARDDRRAEAGTAGRVVRARRDARPTICARGSPRASPDAPPEYPPLVWVAAPHVVAGARLSADATALDMRRGTLRASLVAEDRAQSLLFRRARRPQFFAQRTRQGARHGSTTARSSCARCGPRTSGSTARRRAQPLAAGPAADARAARAHARRARRRRAEPLRRVDAVAARSRRATPVPPGRAVLGIMVNGAQGDDDEAHARPLRARHRPHARGRRDRRLARQQLLHARQRKRERHPRRAGSARQLPRRPQQRPGLVPAVAHAGRGARRRPRAPRSCRRALNRVYNQFWRHQLVYRHATMNCTGISVDVLRALGWDVPARGPASRLVAALGFPVLRASRSARSPRRCIALRLSDRGPDAAHAGGRLRGSRREPACARRDGPAAATPRTGRARADARRGHRRHRVRPLSAISVEPRVRRRAGGHAVGIPVARARRSGLAQIVPVPPRPFPAALRDPDLLPASARRPTTPRRSGGSCSSSGIPDFPLPPVETVAEPA